MTTVFFVFFVFYIAYVIITCARLYAAQEDSCPVKHSQVADPTQFVGGNIHPSREAPLPAQK